MTVENYDPDLARAPFTWKTLSYISDTEFVPRGLRGNEHAILAAILYGRELGMGPMESMQRIDVIDGRPTPTGEWMVAKVFEAGHAITVEHQDAKKVVVTGSRVVGEREITQSVTWTAEMAERAGLAKKSNWRNYPEAMLYWRAVSQLCRQFFPDVLGGLRYLPDELGDADWSEAGTFTMPDGTTHAFDATPEEIEGQEALDYDEDDPERPFEKETT